jgi:hypothetical protein
MVRSGRPPLGREPSPTMIGSPPVAARIHMQAQKRTTLHRKRLTSPEGRVFCGVLFRPGVTVCHQPS